MILLSRRAVKWRKVHAQIHKIWFIEKVYFIDWQVTPTSLLKNLFINLEKLPEPKYDIHIWKLLNWCLSISFSYSPLLFEHFLFAYYILADKSANIILHTCCTERSWFFSHINVSLFHAPAKQGFSDIFSGFEKGKCQEVLHESFWGWKRQILLK